MCDSDDEHFAKFGAPLDPLDEDNLPRKKAITIEDQYAYDTQGRRRFHGAFTGGFSAGYFNSVGTRDGWKPQHFKSSRSSKAGNISQRPEDFMDEEDTSEFGIAPKGIRATSDYVDHERKGTKRERNIQNNTGPIPGVPVLKELLRPAKETVGVILLKKMGWKPGQGVGPRVTKKEKEKIKHRNEQVKIYGCALPQSVQKETLSDADDSDIEADITFAPDDYEPYRCNPKDNYFGIGYSGLDRRPVLSGHVNLFDTPAFNVQDKNKKLSIRGQAFGVGAFEADDEDIYERDDMSRYDFTLGPERKAKSRWSQSDSLTSQGCLEGFVYAKNTISTKNRFPPPELPKDFVPIHVVRKSRFYPPIESQIQNDKNNKLNAKDRGRILDDCSLTFNQTTTNLPGTSAVILPVDKTRSVASNIIHRTLNLDGKQFIQEKQKQEVQQTKAAASWMDKLNLESFVKGGVINNDAKFVTSDKDDKQQGFANTKYKVAFAEPDKQARFEKYLTFLKNDETKKLASIQPLSFTEWEREQEATEFCQMAKLCESSTSDVSDKFVNGDGIDDKERPSSGESGKTDTEKDAEAETVKEPTRTISDWKPTSIVCKRFNVPEPIIGCANPETDKKTKKLSIFDSLNWSADLRFSKATHVESDRALQQSSGSSLEHDVQPLDIKQESTFGPVKIHSTALSGESITKSLSEKTRNFEASYEKIFGRGIQEVGDKNLANIERDEKDDSSAEPHQESPKEKIASTPEEKKDLFKAIFLSSSEDSESDSEDENAENEVMKSVLIGVNPEELNSKRNTSPPRGIFAKLDLNNLTKQPSEERQMEKSAKTSAIEGSSGFSDKLELGNAEQRNECSMEVTLLPDAYGPALPARLVKPDNQNETTVNAAQGSQPIFKSVVVPKLDSKETKYLGEWVERGKLKKSKKEKKKVKHKDHKHSKHKRKSKKEKR